MEIVPYLDNRFDEVVAFVSRLNQQPSHHIGYLEQGEQELVHDLGELAVPMSDTFQLAYDGAQLVGVMGYDADATLGKVWLLGPFVDHPDWQETAGALYDILLQQLPAELNQLELFANTENENVTQFAQIQGFRQLVAAHVMRKLRPIKLPQAPAEVSNFEPYMARSFSTLHEVIFPDAYYAAAQLIEMVDANHRLLVCMRQSEAAGYAFVKLAPEIGRAYLDFLGVAQDARRRGLGRALLDVVIGNAFALDAINRLELTVNADNEIALQLYHAADFEIIETLRGYRRSR